MNINIHGPCALCRVRNQISRLFRAIRWRFHDSARRGEPHIPRRMPERPAIRTEKLLQVPCAITELEPLDLGGKWLEL